MHTNITHINFEKDLLLTYLEKRYRKPFRLDWEKNFKWIVIYNFPLPKSYNQKVTNILIVIPTGYGYGTKIEEFYVNKNLKVKQGRTYVDLPHYYNDNLHKGVSYSEKNWQWLCINPQKAKGDGLVTFFRQVEIFLEFPFDEMLR
jgi:hypothetical protein